MSLAKDTNLIAESSERATNGRPPETLAGGFNPADIYYTLFRHKWIILVGVLLGIAAAGYLYLTRTAMYASEARLLVRYVRETKSIDAPPGSAQVTSTSTGAESVLNTEIEILTSFDLAAQVADLVGPDKVLPGVAGGADRAEAAVAILKTLSVEIPRRSNAIRLSFHHSDPETAQTVLRQLIDAYRRKHAEVHRALGVADEFLTRQTDELRSRLNQTETELRTLKASVGVIFVEDAKKELLAQRSKIQQDLIAAESELSERRTVLEQARLALGVRPANEGAAPATNDAPAVVEPPLPAETLGHYRSVRARLESFRTRELDLLSQFGDDSPLLKDLRARIAAMQKVQMELEQEYPRLLAMPTPVLAPLRGDAEPRLASVDLDSLTSAVAALEARVRYLNGQWDKVKAETAILDANESRLNELERKRALEEANYRYFAANLEQARVDQAIGTGNLPNISVVQEASPPYRESRQMMKLMGKALAGGTAAGFGLAFLLEFFLDRSIRKPSQVGSLLRLPLFLTVPAIRRRALSRRAAPKASPHRAPNGRAGGPSPAVPGIPGGPTPQLAAQAGSAESHSPVAGAPAWEEQPAFLESTTTCLAQTEDPLALYHEALRDRVVMYFEINGLTHRPKLVGLTSTASGAGTTTLASGLAASLSETGDGNVLFVDMNGRNGAGVHPFYRGKAICGLDDALQQDTRSHAKVHEHLYVVTAQTGSGQRVGLVPRKFANIVPRLQAADYDYIIFDLPPVSQTSVTSKLAGLLDMTLLVLESEKAKQDGAQNALALLAESKAKVAAVLNKHRPYLPRFLQTES